MQAANASWQCVCLLVQSPSSTDLWHHKACNLAAVSEPRSAGSCHMPEAVTCQQHCMAKRHGASCAATHEETLQKYTHKYTLLPHLCAAGQREWRVAKAVAAQRACGWGWENHGQGPWGVGGTISDKCHQGGACVGNEDLPETPTSRVSQYNATSSPFAQVTRGARPTYALAWVQ